MQFITGIKEFDDVSGGGINSSYLIYISGAKESGKNAFANLIIENVAKNQVSSAFFCLEFSAKYYLDYLKFKYKHEEFKHWKNEIRVEDRITDIVDIENKIREWHEQGILVFFIDSILRITHNTFSGSGTATDDIYLRLEALKKELDIVIMIVVQVTKGSLHSPFKKLYNANFSNDKADIWIHLNSTEEDLVKKVEVIKTGRNGDLNSSKTFNYKFNIEERK
jgi:predicted ATP-dependent serine protease